jgi:hypothetical protein
MSLYVPCYRPYNKHNTNIHASGGIRTRNPSKRAAVDPRLRPHGHWDRLGSNPGLRDEKPATNRLSHGTAYTVALATIYIYVYIDTNIACLYAIRSTSSHSSLCLSGINSDSRNCLFWITKLETLCLCYCMRGFELELISLAYCVMQYLTHMKNARLMLFVLQGENSATDCVSVATICGHHGVFRPFAVNNNSTLELSKCNRHCV